MKQARAKEHRVYMVSMGLRMHKGGVSKGKPLVALSIVPRPKVIRVRFALVTHILYSEDLDRCFDGDDLK